MAPRLPLHPALADGGAGNMTRYNGMSLLLACLLAALGPGSLSAEQGGGKPARIAVILDQTNPRFESLVEAFEREVRGFFRPGEIELLPPSAGDGRVAGLEG